MITPEMGDFKAYMTLRGLSAVTVSDRLEVLDRMARFLDPVQPLDAQAADLERWQAQYLNLASSSVDIYTRHVQAFYRWAAATGRIAADPAVALVRPRVPVGRPHPTSADDLRTVFACATGPLRTAFALAAFAGLRRGEICRLQMPDIDFEVGVAVIHGKGAKVRRVPLVQPVLDEIRGLGRRHGYVLVRDGGMPYTRPDLLSGQCNRFLATIGVESTLHSMRHAFATNVYRTTRDLLFVAELLGHASAQTTQIYAMPDLDHMQERMVPVSDMADSLLHSQRARLHAV